MSRFETNVFPIVNLSQLSSSHRLYRIRGLHPEQAEYHQNRQIISRRLSYATHTPATVIEHEGEPHLVLRDDAPEPSSPYKLVRRTVYFEPIPGIRQLDYAERDPENDEICLRFVNFTVQTPLNSNPLLWQPGSGEPFFEKTPSFEQRDVVRYTGFSVRAVIMPDGGIGLCVDVKHRMASRIPLPVRLDRAGFKRWRGTHCIYHYGHRWYVIQLHEFNDLNVSEVLIPRDGADVTLLEYVLAEAQKPLPQELANLPHDASVVSYMSNQGELRGAPAGLCYPIIDTRLEDAGRHHGGTILKPHERRAAIHLYASEHLRRLRFGAFALEVAPIPVSVPQKMFLLPDYEFGNSRIVSVRGTPNAQNVSLDAIGRTRAELLRDPDAGFYTRDRLDRQYLFLPQSVADSYGRQFRADLTRVVDELYPQGGGYDPIVVTYNDRGPRTFVEQGNAIRAAAEQHCSKPGFALVMIHHTSDRRHQHDQLAAMVVRELRKLDVYAAVNHSAMGHECYEMAHGRDGKPLYRVRGDKRGKFSGYLRNVALNKILLTNEKWPFVLATPLHADVTVGIDVKQNTAGFTIVAGNGSLVRTRCHESRQKERLLTDQVKKYFSDIIREEAAAGVPIRNIVVHRDGRLWPSEREGLRKALAELESEGTLPPDATVTMLELWKKSRMGLRLFDVAGSNGQREWVENPQVGSLHVAGMHDAFLCATGRAFRRAGTVQPLHVRYVEGGMDFESCLEDLYHLTALTWSRPEDCSRYPITLKLTDRRLGEDASDYDADALEFEESEEIEA